MSVEKEINDLEYILKEILEKLYPLQHMDETRNTLNEILEVLREILAKLEKERI